MSGPKECTGSEPAGMPPHRFAVPVVLLRTIGFPRTAANEKRRATSKFLETLPVSVSVFAYHRRSAMVRMRKRVEEAMQDKGLVPETVPLLADGNALDVIMAGNSEVHVLGDEETMRFRSSSDDERRMLAEDVKLFEAVSAVTGFRIEIHFPGLLFMPPKRTDGRTLVYHPHARPPGLIAPGHHVFPTKEIDGIPLWKDGSTRFVSSPTKGRGRFVSIGGAMVLQVLGRNYYQLQLTYSEEHGGNARVLLVGKVAGAVIADLEAHASPTSFRSQGESTASALNEFAEDLIDSRTETVRHRMSKLKKEIAEAQEALAKKLIEQRELFVIMNALMESSVHREVRDRLPDELVAIKGIEGVAEVEVVDGGIHLTSEPLVLEHEGVRYPMGVFTIRLDPDNCLVEAWNDDPRHPEGHHHPHIGSRELSCFGNVNLALSKALAAHRYFDAATLAMRWLRTYSADTTLYKIEEWPSEKSDGKETKEKTHVTVV